MLLRTLFHCFPGVVYISDWSGIFGERGLQRFCFGLSSIASHHSVHLYVCNPSCIHVMFCEIANHVRVIPPPIFNIIFKFFFRFFGHYFWFLCFLCFRYTGDGRRVILGLGGPHHLAWEFVRDAEFHHGGAGVGTVLHGRRYRWHSSCLPFLR